MYRTEKNVMAAILGTYVWPTTVPFERFVMFRGLEPNKL